MDFEIVRTYERFLSLRDDWDGLLKENNNTNFYLTFDWFYAVLSFSQNPPRNLYIVKVRSEGNVVAFIPCFITKKRLRFFSLRCLELIGNIYSPYRGCIVKKEKENEVVDGLVEFLTSDRANEWDIIRFENLSPKDSFVSRFGAAFKKRNARCRRIDDFVNVIIDFSSFKNSEEYFKSLSKKTRRNIKQDINRINRDGDFDIVLTMDRDQDLDVSMSHYKAIYDASWKKSEAHPDFHSKLAKYVIGKKCLRLFVLYYRPFDMGDDQDEVLHTFPSLRSEIQRGRAVPDDYIPLAAFYVIYYGGHAYALKTAYREEYSKYSPGTVIFCFLVKYLIDADKCKIIDLQKGDDAYKFKWGEINETLIKYHIANPKSIRANFELWNEHHLISKVKKTKDWISVKRAATPGRR